MKKFAAAMAAALSLAVLGLSGCAQSGAKTSAEASAENPMVLTLAHGLSETHTVHIAMTEFADKVEERTNGRIQVRILPNGQLGSENENMEQLMAGVISMTKVSAPGLATYNESYHAFGLPYIFDDTEDFYHVMDSDPMQDFFLSSSDDGFVTLTYYTSGARSFYTKNKAIRTPADLKGLKIRVQDMKSQTDMMKALGGIPVAMSYGDVYTSLQTGIIDGTENNETALTTGKHGEICKVYSTDQGVYDTRKEISIMLGWDPDRVVVENKLVGGGFGGKEDVSAQHIAALAALKVQRPVKVVFSRQESLSFHPKRHAMEGTFTLGCDENGIFTGLDCEIYFDTGAYASLCGPVLERACTHSVGPYCYQNTDIRGFGYYTNNPPAGAFRGFGVCQSEFALESNINLLAEKVGISPWEIRYRNAIEPGKVLPNGQIADCSTALKETLLAVKDAYESNPGRAGIACAMKNAGVGVGLPDKGRAKLAVRDGKIELYSAASDIGQGCATVFVQMVSETTGLGKEMVRNMGANSEVAPDSGTTSGSRQTLITGEAVRMAAADLNEALQEAGGDLSQLEGREFFAEFFDPTDKLGADVPNPKSHVAYGFATHVVVLDDDGRVKEVYAAHDSGKVVNPISIQGQIEGGVLMGLGYALTEDFPLKNGVPQAKYGTLGLMRSTQIPDIHAIYVEKEELLSFAYGAKGIGEIATIPTAPAAQGAYYAKDHVLRTTLPMDDTYYSKKK